MRKHGSRFGIMLIIVAALLISAFAAFVPSSLQLSSTEAVVVGTRTVGLSPSGSYLFKSNTVLTFEAAPQTGWSFDHIEIDFGCEVGGVTGSNVSKIFHVDGGYIESCLVG